MGVGFLNKGNSKGKRKNSGEGEIEKKYLRETVSQY